MGCFSFKSYFDVLSAICQCRACPRASPRLRNASGMNKVHEQRIRIIEGSVIPGAIVMPL